MRKPYLFNYEFEILASTGPSEVSYDDFKQYNQFLKKGPDTDILTESTENDLMVGPDTEIETATTENIDYVVSGPETTTHTYVIENDDKDEYHFWPPETTIETRSNENNQAFL